ncbi:hypothetical protein P691DRAFT_807783 [Macrolepiota fuliginosa MF-IS2]|uniref:Uncharacterized protein n=1 Tax=Macrolepiota fuliginosa MF-IS2 TaxID=1400762 RepID=A0A9P5XI94_9AGAR|nr:hypothetical protein P691DRAFT_807783 [Macrolepiota fuliginosa MF-IS2]
MTLKEGLYRIRFVPVCIQPPFVGGVYARSTEIGEPIAAKADGPEDPPQVWEVRLQNGKYIITQPGFSTKLPFMGPGPVLAGWGLAEPSDKFPGGPILFKVGYQEFDIQPVGEGDSLMYSIKVPNPQGIHSPGLNAEFYVTEDKHILQSQAFWSNLRFKQPNPCWQFLPVSRK